MIIQIRNRVISVDRKRHRIDRLRRIRLLRKYLFLRSVRFRCIYAHLRIKIHGIRPRRRQNRRLQLLHRLVHRLDRIALSVKYQPFCVHTSQLPASIRTL